MGAELSIAKAFVEVGVKNDGAVLTSLGKQIVAIKSMSKAAKDFNGLLGQQAGLARQAAAALAAKVTAGSLRGAVSGALRRSVGGSGVANSVISMAGEASPRALRTFQLSLEILIAKIGEVFIPVLAKASLYLQRAADLWDNLGDTAQTAIGSIAGLAGGLVALQAVGMLGPVMTGVKLLLTGLVGMSAPALAAAAALAAVTAGLIALWNAQQQRASRLNKEMDKAEKGEALTKEELEQFEKTGQVGRATKGGGFAFDQTGKALEGAKTHDEQVAMARQNEAALKQRYESLQEDYNKRGNKSKGIAEGTGAAQDMEDAATAVFRARRVRKQLESGKSYKQLQDEAKSEGGKDGLKLARPSGTASFSSLDEAWKRVQLGALNSGDLESKKMDLLIKGDQKLERIANATEESSGRKPDVRRPGQDSRHASG